MNIEVHCPLPCNKLCDEQFPSAAKAAAAPENSSVSEMMSDTRQPLVKIVEEQKLKTSVLGGVFGMKCSKASLIVWGFFDSN